jgi:hypothetical protein
MVVFRSYDGFKNSLSFFFLLLLFFFFFFFLFLVLGIELRALC